MSEWLCPWLPGAGVTWGGNQSQLCRGEKSAKSDRISTTLVWDTLLSSDSNYCFYFLNSWESEDVRKMKRFMHAHSLTKHWCGMVINTADVIISTAWRVTHFLQVCSPSTLGRLSPLQGTHPHCSTSGHRAVSRSPGGGSGRCLLFR